MPTRADWRELLRQTFHGLDRKDVRDLYEVEWQRAYEALIAEHRESIDAEKRRLRRWFRKLNALLYGLTRRLAPTRRLLFVVALLLALVSPLQFRVGEVDTFLMIDVHFVGFALLTLLLGMELVDKIHFRDELFLARDVQASLLPKKLPEMPGLELGAYNRIANTVGGDLYDFFPLADGRLAVLFGDASGHGMAAGLVMAVTHAAFRTQAAIDAGPDVVFAALNRVLCTIGGRRSFFAGVVLVLSPDGAFTARVAGHPPILRIGVDGTILERIGIGAYPLGIKPDMQWAALDGTLGPGETLLFTSDGLSEARNAGGVEFGEARIEAVIARKAGAGAAELTGAISAELAEFLGRRAPEDDVSIAAIRKKP